MKKLYFIFALCCAASVSNAALHTVTVNLSNFSPSTVNAVCGDTVSWVLGSGSHTTTSTTIPACATPWNSPINATMPAYAIVVPCAGTYNYQCSPHGFTGVINVTCPSGVSPVNNSHLSVSYPSPFSTKITIETSGADRIALFNMMGEKIKTVTLQNGQTKAEINASDLAQGIYFYSIIKEGIIIETRKIVKN